MEKRKAHYPLTTVKRVATECRVSFSTAPQFVETRRRLYLRSTFTLQIALSILLAGGTAVVGAVYAHKTGLHALQDNLLPLVAAIVAFQLQDLAPTLLFCRGKQSCRVR